MGGQHEESTAQHTVHATYRIAPGDEHEAAFVALLTGHWGTLHKLGLVTDEPARIYRQVDEQGRVTFVEVFTWLPAGVGTAHEHPEVAAIWGPMAEHCAEQDGRPAMEFPHYAVWSAPGSNSDRR